MDAGVYSGSVSADWRQKQFVVALSAQDAPIRLTCCQLGLFTTPDCIKELRVHSDLLPWAQTVIETPFLLKSVWKQMLIVLVWVQIQVTRPVLSTYVHILGVCLVINHSD